MRSFGYTFLNKGKRPSMVNVLRVGRELAAGHAGSKGCPTSLGLIVTKYYVIIDDNVDRQ